MKKTLIALAAVAVAGTAFAQNVTLSGRYAVSFQQAIGANSGLATTDGHLTFSATEDLGSGMRAGASLEIRVRGRGAADDTSASATPLQGNDGVGGRNASLFVSGGFGTVTLGSVEAGNGIIARGFAGAPVSLATAYDGAVLSGPANVDWFMYTTPALLPGLTANFQRTDSITAPGGGKGTFQANTIGVNYAQGPLSAGFDYTDFSGQGANAAQDTRSRIRLSASYDLGVARLGFGMEDNRGIAPETDGRQYALGVSVPMGAFTFGAIYARNSETWSTTAAARDSRGWGIGMDYALSKRTTLNVSYADRTRANGASDSDGDQFRIRLMHTF